MTETGRLDRDERLARPWLGDGNVAELGLRLPSNKLDRLHDP